SFYNRDAGERRDGAGGCRRQPSHRDADRRPGAPRQRLSDPCRPCAGDRGDPAGDGRAAGWETVTRLFGTDGIRGVANEEPLTPEGTKFPDAWEDEVEARLKGADNAPRASGAGIGRHVTYDRAERYYIDYLSRCFPVDLGGMTIAIDCAHGATFRVAPRVF